MALSKEATQLHAQLQDFKARWVKLQDAIESESAFVEQVHNLEVALSSKIEEATPTEEKQARMEERFKKIMKKNWVHITTICDLDLILDATRSERDGLHDEVVKLK